MHFFLERRAQEVLSCDLPVAGCPGGSDGLCSMRSLAPCCARRGEPRPSRRSARPHASALRAAGVYASSSVPYGLSAWRPSVGRAHVVQCDRVS